MPKQETKTNALNKVVDKARKAHAEHKNAAVTFGNAELPEIPSGVARLIDMHFGTLKEGENKGQPFFMAAATVVEPKEVKGIPCVGLRTQIGPEPLCDTPNSFGDRKTFGQHWAWMSNVVKWFAPEAVEAIREDDPQFGEKWENLVAAVKMAAPFVRFRTFRPKKQEVKLHNGKWHLFVDDQVDTSKSWPTEAAAKAANRFADGKEKRVIHMWNGAVQYNQEADAGAATEDGSAGAEPSANGQPAAQEAADTFSEFSVAELVQAAKDDNEAAREKLAEMCKANGYSEQEVTDAPDWDEVGRMAETPKEEAAEEGEDAEGEGEGGDEAAEEAPAEEEAWKPAKGQVYAYKYKPDPKKAGKKIEVIIVNVDEAKQTVTVQDNGTKKPLLGGDKKPLKIKWDDLESAE